MARVNVYLPDELAEEAKAAGLNVSSLTQEALRRALAAHRTDDWLDGVAAPAADRRHPQRRNRRRRRSQGRARRW